MHHFPKKRCALAVLAACSVAVCAQPAMAVLTIANGDFSDTDNPGGHDQNVNQWFDWTQNNFAHAWVIDNAASPNDTPILILAASGADDSIDNAGNNSWAYQSIGTSDGASSVSIDFLWGSFDDAGGPRDMGLTFTIYENDGTFAGADDVDALGPTGTPAAGLTQIAQMTEYQDDVGIGQTFNRSWTFDLSSVSSPTNQLILRINNYEAPFGTGNDPNQAWVGVDNIVIPEPASIALLGLGGFALLGNRRRTR